MSAQKIVLAAIKMANKFCDITVLTKGRIAGTTQKADIETILFTQVPCRYEQKIFSKTHPISQMVEQGKVAGVFYVPFSFEDTPIEVLHKKNTIVYQGDSYMVLDSVLPSVESYVKIYVQKI